MIPAVSHAIVDEAHQLEDVATQYFGVSVSTYRLEDFAHDVERFALSDVDDADARADIAKAVDTLRDHTRSFFSELALAHRERGPDRMRACARASGGSA